MVPPSGRVRCCPASSRNGAGTVPAPSHSAGTGTARWHEPGTCAGMGSGTRYGTGTVALARVRHGSGRRPYRLRHVCHPAGTGTVHVESPGVCPPYRCQLSFHWNAEAPGRWYGSGASWYVGSGGTAAWCVRCIRCGSRPLSGHENGVLLFGPRPDETPALLT